MKSWPDRNACLQWSENELDLVSPCTLFRLFGHRRPSTSLTPRRQHCLKRTVLGVRFSVKLKRSLLPSYFLCGHKLSRPLLHPCASSHPVPCHLQASLQSSRLQVFCALVDNESVTPPCPTNTDALLTTRVRLDAIPRLFPGYVAFRPAMSTNLPSTQHKLSTNSLQTQLFASLSASAED